MRGIKLWAGSGLWQVLALIIIQSFCAVIFVGDEATFTIKKCSVAAIAGMCGLGDGTIKSHFNVTDCKSGTTGWAQLVSVSADDLSCGVLVGSQAVSGTA